MGFNDKQLDIIEEKLDKNILVSAAAGSGKTTVLTEKIVKTIADVDNKVSISNILIMTFTKKATGEMKARISKRLSKEFENVKEDLKNAKSNGADEKKHKRIYEKLLEESSLIQNANILTIDAFCKKILEENYTYLSKENSLYYDFDISYKVGDDREMVLLKEEVLTDFFEKNYQNDEYKKLFDSYVEKNNESELRKLMLDGIYKLSVVPWPVEYLDDKIKHFVENSHNAYNEYKKICIDKLLEYKKEFDDIKNDVLDEKVIYEDALVSKKNGKGNAIKEDTLNKIKELIEDIEKLISFFDNFNVEEILETGDKKIEINVDKYNEIVVQIEKLLTAKFSFVTKTNFKIEDQDRHNELKDIIREEIKEISLLYRQLKNLVASESEILNENELLYLKFLKDFYVALLNAKKKRNTYEISDFSNITLDILYDKSDGEYGNGNRVISKHVVDIAKKYKYIFIDEYQDTNFVQETIIKALSNDFKNGNVFMVGDVKQSIYRFRNAEPGIFVEKYISYKEKKVENGLIKTLDTNYRSSKEIIGYVNDLFSKTMTKNYGDIDYLDGHSLVPRDEENKREIDDKKLVEIKIVCKADNSNNSSTNAIENEDKISSGDEKNLKTNKTGDDSENTNVENTENSSDARNTNNENYSGSDIEADYVATLIEDMVKNKKKDYKDIVILLRSAKGKAKIYEEALTRHKIPVYAEQKSGFFDRLEIRFMVDLLTAIDNPLQNVPLASVLTSNVFSFTNDDLALMKVMQNEYYRIKTKNVDSNEAGATNIEKYKNYYFNVYDQLKFLNKCFWTEEMHNDESKNVKDEKDSEFKVKPVSDEEISILNEKFKNSGIDKNSLKNKISSVLNILKVLQFKSRYMSVSDLIDYIYDILNVKEIMGSMPDGKLRVANLNLLYDLAVKFEATSNVFLFNFNRYIERIKEVNLDAGLAKIYDENANAVRIMTIHSSKGLEFDTVFLCSTQTDYNLKDINDNTLYQFNRKDGFALDCYDVKKKMIVSSPKKLYMAEKEIDAMKQEELRTLYVALTRAVNKLYIVGYSTKTGSGFTNKELDEFEEKKSQKLNIDKKIKDCLSYLDVILSHYPVTDEKYCSYERVEWNIQEINDLEEEVDFDKLYSNNDREDIAVKSDVDGSYFNSINDKILDENLVDNYKYKFLQSIPPKFSVTGIKSDNENMVDRSEYIINDEDDDNDDAMQDKKVSDKHILAGAELGNAYHRYMQFYDYKENELGGDLKNNVDLSFAKNVSQEKISKFLKSPIGKEMNEAFLENRLYREHKFMKLFSKNEIDSFGKNSLHNLKNSDMNNNGMQKKTEIIDNFDEENIIIQGIIDAFYVKKDEKGNEYIVLVDYKTDEINTKNLDYEKFSSVIANRHRLQLDIYGRVLKDLTGLEVRKKYIYSFALDKEVEV